MAVTNERSTQLASYLDTVPRTLLDNLDLGGCTRVARFTFTQGAAAGDSTSTATLFEAQARERLVGHLSKLYFSAFGGSRTLDVGYAAHTNLRTGATVIADPNFFCSDVDVSSAGSCTFDESGTSGAYDGFVFEGKAEVLATVGGSGTIPAAATLKGFAVLVGTP